MNKHRQFLLAALLPAVTCLAEAAVITFDSATPSSFTAAFPTQILVGTAGSFSVVSDPVQDQAKLHAQLGSDSQFSFARAAAFSAASSSYNFLANAATSSVTFTFGNVDMLGGAGVSGTSFLGVFSGNSGGITAGSGPNDGLYFFLNQNSNSLIFRQRLDGATFDIQTIALGTVSPRYSFSTLSLTTNGSTYSITVTQDGTGNGVGTNNPVNSTVSGTFANSVTAANWGSNFYLGLQADLSNTASVRYTDLFVGSIAVDSVSAVPEPSAYATLMGAFILGGAMLRRRRQ